MRYGLLCVCLLLGLSACDSLPSWMGGPKKVEKKLEGTRIDVLREDVAVKADASLTEAPAAITAQVNAAWPEHGGSAKGRPEAENPALAQARQTQQSAEVGKGNTFTYHLTPPPIVADNMVFAMDANGAVSAHDAKDIRKVKWTSAGAAVEDSEGGLGGGLAYRNGRVFVASGKGLVVALSAATGVEIWRQNFNMPVHAAPRADDAHVYVSTVDSQLFALNAQSGAIVWNHRGVDEGRGYLNEGSPAVNGDLVVVPYPSGELHGLHADGGDDIWSDGVVGSQKQSANSVFTGISGDPVLTDDGMLYVAGSAAQFAVFQAETGKRVWEQPISSVNTPYVAGDFVYVLATNSTLVCMQRMDGRVKWNTQLPEFAKPEEKKGHYTWNGPVLAGGRLLVAGAHGVMLEVSPVDGKILATTDIPDGMYSPPVVAQDTLYFVTEDATLHAWR